MNPNPRSTIRGWTAPSDATNSDHSATATIWDDGSVALVASVGGHRQPWQPGDKFLDGQFATQTLESCVIDLIALVEAVGTDSSIRSYDIELGVEPAEDQPIKMWATDTHHHAVDPDVVLPRTRRVRATISLDDDVDAQLRDLALDLVNQGGIEDLKVISTP